MSTSKDVILQKTMESRSRIAYSIRRPERVRLQAIPKNWPRCILAEHVVESDGNKANDEHGKPKPIYRRRLSVQNENGLHLTTSSSFASLAAEFISDIRIVETANGGAANAKSVMEVMWLCLPKGAEFVIEAEGDDAEQAVNALEKLTAAGFLSPQQFDDWS